MSSAWDFFGFAGTVCGVLALAYILCLLPDLFGEDES